MTFFEQLTDFFFKVGDSVNLNKTKSYQQRKLRNIQDDKKEFEAIWKEVGKDLDSIISNNSLMD